jgi:hypothetical protein
MAQEIVMFSLKYDLLFPSIASAKELARKLRPRHKPPRSSPPDPRELKRIRDELRLAREQMKAQATAHRYHVF